MQSLHGAILLYFWHICQQGHDTFEQLRPASEAGAKAQEHEDALKRSREGRGGGEGRNALVSAEKTWTFIQVLA